MRGLPSFVLASSFSLSGGTSQAQAAEVARPLTKAEKALVLWVDAHQPEALALLERAVNVNSGTLNFAGVRAVGALFREELDRLGFTTRWEDGTPFERAGHLVATRQGNGANRLRVLLIGHLDTVFEQTSPFQRFERLDATTARGPGIIDMKGGDVILVQTLGALRAAELLDRFDVTLILTGDEEKAGRPLALARRTLIEAAQTADVAIGLEDGDGDPHTAVVARRGSTSWELRVTGPPAHSSLIFRPEAGSGAIFEAARVLEAFRVRLAGEPYLTFNPGIVAGGTTALLEPGHAGARATGKDNVIAAEAVVRGDLRTLTPDQLERARAAMCAIASEPLPLASSTLTFDEGYPPMAPTDGNRRLLALYDQASRDLGLGEVHAVDPAKAGAADVSFAAPLVGSAIDGIGLRGRGGHTSDETADLTTLASQTKRLAVLLHRLTLEPRTPRPSR